MKMNPINIPFHEAGHVVVCQELGVPMTEAVVSENEAHTAYDFDTLSSEILLCVLVAGHVAEHLFGAPENRFPLLSCQLDQAVFKCFQEDNREDLAMAKGIASIMSNMSEYSGRYFVVVAEEEAMLILRKRAVSVKAIADELRRLGHITDQRAKELIGSPPT